MSSINDNRYPIGFKVAAGSRVSTLFNDTPGNDVFIAEVRHVGHDQKEAVVEDGRNGPRWRLASDEGVHLKGDDTFEILQRVAANTYYLHQTMIQLPPLLLTLRHNDKILAL